VPRARATILMSVDLLGVGAAAAWWRGWRFRRSDTRVWVIAGGVVWLAFALALAAVGFAMLLGKLAAVAELMHAWHSLIGYRWWLPSRVVAHTANAAALPRCVSRLLGSTALFKSA
jgi:hypothetical protein